MPSHRPGGGRPPGGKKGAEGGPGGVAGGMRRRPIDVQRKLPLVRSTKEIEMGEDTQVAAEGVEETINTVQEQEKLKEIPVPKSKAEERVIGTTTFTLPPGEFLKSVPPENPHTTARVLWHIDMPGYRFLKELNGGSVAGYSGPKIEEPVFELLIDRLEKAVRTDKSSNKEVKPTCADMESQLAASVPDGAASVIKVVYGWWERRRKELAMPLVRELRPPPDPADEEIQFVAFRPREEEGARKMRTNNKKTFAMMEKLRDEFRRLQQICELIKRRERLKLAFHQAAGEYTEAAHRTITHRLARARAGGAATFDDFDDEPQRKPSHKKQDDRHRSDRSHKRPSAMPQKFVPESDGRPIRAPRDRDRDRDRDRARGAGAGRGYEYEVVDERRERERERARMRAERPPPEVEDVDSEEEAYSQMVLTVDTAKRDDHERLLPRHLRGVGDKRAAAAAAAAAAAIAAAAGAGLRGAAASAAKAAATPAAAGAPAAAAAAAAPSVPAGAAAPHVRRPLGIICEWGGRRGGRRGGAFARIGRGGRVLFDRPDDDAGGLAFGRYRPLPGGFKGSASHELLSSALRTGRPCKRARLEGHLNADEAWRQNAPLRIVRGAEPLFDFGSIPKFVSAVEPRPPPPEPPAAPPAAAAPTPTSSSSSTAVAAEAPAPPAAAPLSAAAPVNGAPPAADALAGRKRKADEPPPTSMPPP